jgi:DNA-binding NarL/FixJ family response regulator
VCRGGLKSTPYGLTHERAGILGPETECMLIDKADERIFDAMCAGACGCLLKKTPPARLLESLKEAVAGGTRMSPEVARRVALFREIRPPERADYQLTPHETRLLKLFLEGHNYKTAAAELEVSVNTVNFHVRSISEKLQFHSRSEAVAKALINQLV